LKKKLIYSIFCLQIFKKKLKNFFIIRRYIGSSLPDHVDTLLIGYLSLIQWLLEEFFTQLETCVQKTISFCNEIFETHVKKQLSSKAVEILFIIKETSTEEEIKNMVKNIFFFF